MEQATITTTNSSINCLPQKQSSEWKDDPLQMLAKQCDTISGDEDKIKQQIGNKRQQKQYQNGHSNNDYNILKNNNGHGNKTKAKSPNNKFEQNSVPNNSAPFMVTPNGFGLPHPMQLAAAAFLHPLMPTNQRPPSFPPSNNFCPSPNAPPFTSPAQIQLMQQFMAAAQQIPSLNSQQQHPPPHIPPQQQQLPQHFLSPQLFPPQTIPSGIPLPANMPIPARKLDQTPTNNNQFINHQQNSDAELTTLAAMAMFQQQQNILNGQTTLTNNGTVNTINQQTQQPDNSLLAQQLLQQPIQALLMAAACGQLPSQFACPYRLREGQPCGRLFASDDQLFAHYKSAHIAQISSPSAVSSTTEGPSGGSIASTPSTIQTPTTTTAATTNCRPKGAKNSPTGIPTINNQSNKNNFNHNGWNQQLFQSPIGFIPAQPFIGPLIHSLPPPPQPPPISAATMIGAQNHRFHPYAQSNQGSQQKSIQMNNIPSSIQQQMAIALNLMANSDNSTFQQQFIPPNNNNPSSELNNTHSQLAALAAMANSLGGNNNQTQTAGSSG
ncbi:C2H2-type domain-containing protein [Meloidogyne graminicola]|uniref:C2H2-type domain-containing protein n=1 Tax=Meloidogyne graminicola TaxID=189291 RepID=A0A8S9ZX83_9BILA|nr:C2H2-type domain-containing protein [Meloidogyne graminicola]